MKLYLISIASVFSVANGFIFDKPALAPLAELDKMVKAQTDHRLSMGMDIGKPGDTSRIAINGLVVDLSEQAPSDLDDIVKMPGAHGPQPSLSGGLRALTTVQDGSFVSMAGSEVVKATNGCWEIVWKKDLPSGSIICGFQLDQEYKRNDATLPKGPLYVSFNTWTREGLEKEREKRDILMKKANDAKSKKEEELQKVREANNPIQKALHYFNALNAAEKYSMVPVKSMQLVPSPDECIHFGGDMYVSKKGCVWTRDKNKIDPVILGSAKLTSGPRDELRP